MHRGELWIRLQPPSNFNETSTPSEVEMKRSLSAFAVTLILCDPALARTAQQNHENHIIMLRQMNGCVAFYDRSLQAPRDNGKAVMSKNMEMYKRKLYEYTRENDLGDLNEAEKAASQKLFHRSSEMVNGYSVFSEAHPARKYCDKLAVDLAPVKMERVTYDWVAQGKAKSKKLERRYDYTSVRMQCVETKSSCEDCDFDYKIGSDLKIDLENQEFFDYTNNIHVYAIDKEYVPLDDKNFFSNLSIGTKYNLPEISFLNFERVGERLSVKSRHIFEPRFRDPHKNKFTGKKNDGEILYEYKITRDSAKMTYMQGICTLTGYNK